MFSGESDPQPDAPALQHFLRRAFLWGNLFSVQIQPALCSALPLKRGLTAISSSILSPKQPQFLKKMCVCNNVIILHCKKKKKRV